MMLFVLFILILKSCLTIQFVYKRHASGGLAKMAVALIFFKTSLWVTIDGLSVFYRDQWFLLFCFMFTSRHRGSTLPPQLLGTYWIQIPVWPYNSAIQENCYKIIFWFFRLVKLVLLKSFDWFDDSVAL